MDGMAAVVRLMPVHFLALQLCVLHPSPFFLPIDIQHIIHIDINLVVTKCEIERLHRKHRKEMCATVLQYIL